MKCLLGEKEVEVQHEQRVCQRVPFLQILPPFGSKSISFVQPADVASDRSSATLSTMDVCLKDHVAPLSSRSIETVSMHSSAMDLRDGTKGTCLQYTPRDNFEQLDSS